MSSKAVRGALGIEGTLESGGARTACSVEAGEGNFGAVSEGLRLVEDRS